MKLKILLLSFLAVFLCASITSATTIPFGDKENYWPTWGNGPDDGNDTIGTPDFLGGSAEITNGYLTKLTFDIRAKAYLDLWDMIYPGDLFIDTGANETWDYYVDLVQSFDSNNHKPIAGTGNMYSINHPLNDTGYLMSHVPPGYGYREDHPIGFSGGDKYGNVIFDGWPSKPIDENIIVSKSFTFGDGDIPIDSSFIIGWTVTCANDVIYEQVPVPEPSTMLLFGTGFLGLAMIGRKKLFKK